MRRPDADAACDDPEPESDAAEQCKKCMGAVKAFCLKHFLPLGFATALVLGLSVPVRGNVCVCVQRS